MFRRDNEYRYGDQNQKAGKALFHARAYDTLPEGALHYTSVFVRAACMEKAKASANTMNTETERIMDFARTIDFLQDDLDYRALIARYQNE